jgi:hypothetical protein
LTKPYVCVVRLVGRFPNAPTQVIDGDSEKENRPTCVGVVSGKGALSSWVEGGESMMKTGIDALWRGVDGGGGGPLAGGGCHPEAKDECSHPAWGGRRPRAAPKDKNLPRGFFDGAMQVHRWGLARVEPLPCALNTDLIDRKLRSPRVRAEVAFGLCVLALRQEEPTIRGGWRR